MEWQFRLNWAAIVEEAKQRRKTQKLTQQRLAALADVSTPTVSRFESGSMRIELSSALNILGVLGMLDQRMLVFPEPKAAKDFDRETLVFWGKDGEKSVRCAISWQALDDYFKGDRKNKLTIFTANRSVIEHEARRKYLANQFEADGSILIRSGDLS